MYELWIKNRVTRLAVKLADERPDVFTGRHWSGASRGGLFMLS